MRLLLIEDDPDLTPSLSLALRTAGYALDIAADGEQGYFLASTNPYRLILLDYNLPKLSGRAVLEKLRADGCPTPILMITVHSELEDKVDLLNLGADDYLTKPFAVSELLARLQAIARRPTAWHSRILNCGPLRLDPSKFLVTKNDRPVRLSSKEFSLLEYLLAHQGVVLSRQDIMEHVWDYNADPFSNTIEVHIGNLRRKLETAKQRFIFTIPNRGYKLDVER